MLDQPGVQIGFRMPGRKLEEFDEIAVFEDARSFGVNFSHRW